MDEMKIPEEWEEVTDIDIVDPDGWRHPSAKSWLEPLTREDFINRAAKSTCRRRKDAGIQN